MPPTDEKSEPRAAIGLFALKDNEEFLVADALGDIHGSGDGLFRRDTRVLSRFRLKIGAATALELVVRAATAPGRRDTSQRLEPSTAPT